jgi:membrane protein DedA with SNARE-associated domain
MEFNIKNVFKVLIFPISLLILYFSLHTVWSLLDLPPENELIIIITDFINHYGLIVIFIAAIIEGFLLIGNYFPGGAVIFLGVITSIGDIPRAIIVVSVVCLSFFISYTINYFIGKYGWYKVFVKFGLQSSLDLMKIKLSKHIFSGIISSYWLPNLAAICSTTAGIIQVPLKKFLIQSTIGLVIWNIFWGVFAYTTGDLILKIGFKDVLVIFLVWSILIIGKIFIFDKQFKTSQVETEKEIKEI